MPVIINGDTGITQPNEFNSDSTMGFKNRIINGEMDIDQRNAGASVSVTTNGQYTLDRWQHAATQSGRFSVQQNAGSVTPPTGFSNYLGATSSSAYAVLSSDAFDIQQPIEGFNTADLAWGTASAQAITISFWVRSSLTGTFGGALTNSAANRSYPFSYTISAANTWEQKTVTIAGDTTGTWLTNNGIGIVVRFGLGSGSSFSGTAGSWQAGNLIQPTSTVSVVGTNGATFYITGVQLEKGSTATSFDFRDYGRELIMCQRYYQTNTTAIGGAGSSTAAAVSCVLMSEMRATPTATLLNGTNALDELYTAQRTVSSLGGLWGNFEGLRSVGILLNSSGLTALRMVTLFSGRVGLSAEL